MISHGRSVVAMQCRLYSGKTHQIRVHLRDVLGVEILNDAKYGRKRKLDMPIDSKALFLHCQQITIRYCGKERNVFDEPDLMISFQLLSLPIFVILCNLFEYLVLVLQESMCLSF